ncbi:MAG: alpha/beta hydrolase [Gemmatimonadota bacterium]|nr:alpha/beta hydrolase [Gemmatimonadota bacterium]
MSCLHLGGLDLHYVERGSGDDVVALTHGGGQDLTAWDGVVDRLADERRVVAWSRRYCPPNKNDELDPDYSARSDAHDLTRLLQTLAVGAAHHVAHSIGAVAVLFHAVEHPERVRSMVLAEPPVLRWVRDVPGGEERWQEFMDRMWTPSARAFARGERDEAMRIVTDSFVGAGTFDRLPASSRERLMRGARDWEAFQQAKTPFPDLARERVASLAMPVLLLEAERTTELHRMVNDELAKLLPHAERVIIRGATHDMWADRRDACLDATMRFLAEQ